MQDFAMLAAIMREISWGVFLFGLFYVFGMFALGRLFSAFSDGGGEHDVDTGGAHEVGHEIDHEIGHEVDHEIGHEVDHEIGHEVDHEIGHDVDHDVGHEADHDVTHEGEHDIEHSVEHDVDIHHTGFFEAEGGAPLGVTIGTALLVFGFLGMGLYYEGVLIPFAAKVGVHLFGVLACVYGVRTVLGKFLVESGFMIEPKHLVGREVEAVSTVSDSFGEIRTDTEMGPRRFHARPFVKGSVFQKGATLYIVSADAKHVYVDPRKDVMKWVHEQSKREKESDETTTPT